MADATRRPLLDAEATAELLGLSARQVRDLARAGRIPHTRIGRLLRFEPELIEEWIAAHRVEVEPWELKDRSGDVPDRSVSETAIAPKGEERSGSHGSRADLLGLGDGGRVEEWIVAYRVGRGRPWPTRRSPAEVHRLREQYVS